MNKEAERLLKTILKLLPEGESSIDGDDLRTSSGLNEADMGYLLNYLADKDLIEPVQWWVVVIVKTKARYYFQDKKAANIEFIKRSILTPIVVSIITTCLIWFIGWLVGLIH